jgi:O-antigen/teichoic acid export membrane protein
MSRARKAALTASFAYVQYALAIVGGIVLVPLTLRVLGVRTYGLWLASGELLGYAAMVDLGVLGVMPWMLAEADGRRDRAAMRAMLVNGIVAGIVVGIGYAAAAAVLWFVLPALAGLSAADRVVLARPLAILVAATMVSYPLRVFSALIAGVQDVVFNGVLSVVQAVLGISVTCLLLLNGFGLDALAIAAAASMLIGGVASLIRAALLAPDLLSGWPGPSIEGIRLLLANGLGGWFGAFGWRLLAASNSIVIASLGRPEWIAVYACTAKLSAVATQIAWVLPDSGLIGLAQLHGEGKARVQPVVLMMLQLHLLISGAAACVLLAVNPAFVARWVGPELFGGPGLNALLAAGVVVASFVHGLFAAAAVLGNRLRVGAATLVNGAIQVGAALVLGQVLGLAGVALASAVAGVGLALPAGAFLLRQATELPLRSLWTHAAGPWARRAAPVAIAAAAAGAATPAVGLTGAAVLTATVAAAYVWRMRPFYDALPLAPAWRRWLVSLRLLPPAPAMAPVEQP